MAIVVHYIQEVDVESQDPDLGSSLTWIFISRDNGEIEESLGSSWCISYLE